MKSWVYSNYTSEGFKYDYQVYGEWNDEPDHWKFRRDGFRCEIVRGEIGALCGYVGIPRDKVISDEYEWFDDILMHGGVTFGPEWIENYLWIGFDCAHASDICPGTVQYRILRAGATYKNAEYVMAEVQNIVRQLKEKLNRKEEQVETVSPLEYVVDTRPRRVSFK